MNQDVQDALTLVNRKLELILEKLDKLQEFADEMNASREEAARALDEFKKDPMKALLG